MRRGCYKEIAQGVRPSHQPAGVELAMAPGQHQHRRDVIFEIIIFLFIFDNYYLIMY